MNVLKIWDSINDILGQTPLHPQYLIMKEQKQILKNSLRKIRGKVLDIGCGRQLLKKTLLNNGNSYTSLDHPQIYKRQRSKERPDILADITKIPLKTGTYDSALLFMVLPHLPNPYSGMKEIHRILKNKGMLFITAVENYPGHDLPDDYFRFRLKGLIEICKETGFNVVESQSFGNFWEVNSLNFNVFLMQSAKSFLDKTGNIFVTTIIIVFFYPFMLISNIIAILLSPLDFIRTTRLINFVMARKDD